MYNQNQTFLSFSVAVWCGCEKPRCSEPNAAVLRPASREPGVRRHPAATRLPQRFQQLKPRPHVQCEPPQSQHQQQQRPVWAQPQHQHHVEARENLAADNNKKEKKHPNPPVCTCTSSVSHCVTQNQHQWRDIRYRVTGDIPLRCKLGHCTFLNIFYFLFLFFLLILFSLGLKWSRSALRFMFLKPQPNRLLPSAFIPYRKSISLTLKTFPTMSSSSLL